MVRLNSNGCFIGNVIVIKVFFMPTAAERVHRVGQKAVWLQI